MAKSRSFSMSVTINARPGEVFDALTEPRKISKWAGQKGRVDSTIGGKFELFDGWVKGKVLAYQPGKVLAYTWHPTDWSDEWEPSIVKYKFSSTKTGTKIVLNHSGFPNDSEKKSHRSGWTEHVFDPLKKLFESR
jgi:uncharacterized protein YndB with AHSA1/START domain